MFENPKKLTPEEKLRVYHQATMSVVGLQKAEIIYDEYDKIVSYIEQGDQQ